MQIAANAVGTIPASPEKETTEQVSGSQTTLFSDVQSQSVIDSLGSLSNISLDPSMEFDSTLITMDETGLPVSNMSARHGNAQCSIAAHFFSKCSMHKK